MNFQGMNMPYGMKDMTAQTQTPEQGKESGCVLQQPQNMMMNQMGYNPCQTMQGYNQVVNKCYVQEVPHYVNYNTHVVNNCIKKHYVVPTYSQTQETVYVDEYVNQCQNTFNPFMF